MKHFWCEYTCDFCGNGMHVNTDRHSKGGAFESPDKQIRDYGWIVTVDNHHFCCRECYKNYRQTKKQNKRGDE